jgi:hypothetical protein
MSLPLGNDLAGLEPLRSGIFVGGEGMRRKFTIPRVFLYPLRYILYSPVLPEFYLRQVGTADDDHRSTSVGTPCTGR